MLKKILSWTSNSSHSPTGLLILRIAVGLSFVNHGTPKITGGPEKWEKLGGAMAAIGIDFLPTFWGFMAAFSEFFGGIALVLGLFTKAAASGVGFTMFIAFVFHMSRGDGLSRMSHPLELLAVCMLLVLGGAGKYSVDGKLERMGR